ncbi:Putative tetratricopeptide-like helical domain superfamily [Colletotrichum destructivum]|uniref:Tetratricopeptide-like helical domain superfamily n=1 Tax=Colletotrichum destructivum TaxID=34406 RepID=A0AAX4IGC4_9PEZI|nr:Putative tetratricopeptide-like helical domain superfamily [Colletotrichum destructivum]
MGSNTPLPAVASRSSRDAYYDLGNFSLKVSTTSPEAQTWFDRALVWTYCFNHDEAIECYKQAIAHDGDLALAYWGLSFCSGPNYNRTWRLFGEAERRRAVKLCFAYSQEALRRAAGAAPWEQGLIEALRSRFPDGDPDRDLAFCDRAYADAMREVYRRFGQDDFDIITLFADALMNVAPRRLFDTASGEPIATTPVLEVKHLLEAALRMPGVERHPGVAHMYIHLMEMSATPEAALPAADMLRDQIPDTGHTYHMPAHIDVLVGDYRRAVEYNLKATLADDVFFSQAKVQVEGSSSNSGSSSSSSSKQHTFYNYYRLHNYHSLIYAAMLGGMSKAALSATERMEAAVTERLLRTEKPALADWMEFFKAVRVHVYIRFGLWDELKQLRPLEDGRLYCVTNVMRHYGKAIAHAATGEVDEADAERALFREAARLVPPERLDFPNRIRDILLVAAAMLDGEIEYRRGNYAESFERLRDAVALEDELPFAEPWGWMLPARHAYAALSLEQGHVEQAAVAYAEDLGLRPTPKRAHQHPNNVWALHGYHECLVRLGRDAEASIIKRQLTLAAAEADVDVTSSCFCRVGVPKSDTDGRVSGSLCDSC